MALAKTTGNVVFRFFSFGIDENTVRDAKLNKFAKIHICRVVGHTGSLLHIVSDYDNSEVLFQIMH